MSEVDNSAPLGRWPWVVIAAFALVLLLFTKDAPVSWADASRMGTIQGLVEQRTLALDDTDYVWQGDKVQLDGKFYSHQPPMMALLGALPYGVLHMFGRGIADPGTYYWITLFLVGLPVLAGLMCLGKLMRRIGASQSQTAWLLAAASFGTLLLPYSLVLNQHGLAAGLVMISLWAITERRLALAGVLLSVATTTDLTAVFFAIAMVLPVAWPHLMSTNPKPHGLVGVGAVLRYGLGALPVLALHFGINYSIAGDLKPLGLHLEGFEYSMSPFLLMNLTGGGDSGPEGSFLAYAWGALVGSSGLFSHHPVVLWAWVLGAAALIRAARQKQATDSGTAASLLLATSLAAVCITLYYLISSRNFGGSSFGMRWFTVFVPSLFLLPALWFGGRSTAATKRAMAWFWAPLIWSVLAAGLGAVQPWSKFYYSYAESPLGMLNTDPSTHPTAKQHLKDEWRRVSNFHMVFTRKTYDDNYQFLLDQHRKLYLMDWAGMSDSERDAWVRTGLSKLQRVADLLDAENSPMQSRTIAHFWLAKFHMKLGDRIRAKREYEIAIALDPAFSLANSALKSLNAMPR